MQTQDNKSLAMHISVVTIVMNLLLSVGKLLAGFLGHSSAMISDAVHSASDVFSTLVVMVGVGISSRKADDSHQYGHDRLESVAAILLAAILFATGLGIGWSGIRTILQADVVAPAVPSGIALAAAVISIAVKEWMFWYTRAGALRISSDALMADAWHHRSDALSSVGSLVGIGGAMLGYPLCDPIASLIICLLILKAAYDIARDAVAKLVDASCDSETVGQLHELAAAQEGVVRVDRLLTRRFGSMFYVDMEIGCDGTLSIRQGHDIAQRVHDAIEAQFPAAKHCMVHVNPVEIAAE